MLHHSNKKNEDVTYDKPCLAPWPPESQQGASGTNQLKKGFEYQID